jgi:GH15 family glucan-1,4-alpha-glucosidase
MPSLGVARQHQLSGAADQLHRRDHAASSLTVDEGRLLRDGFVMRHDPAEVETGLAHGEGAFLACSFWLVDAMAMTGRAAEGQRLFERLLALRNDVGLLSEEYDVDARRLVGNFPQAFSHIALVNSAHNLARSSKPAEQRSGETAVVGGE